MLTSLGADTPCLFEWASWFCVFIHRKQLRTRKGRCSTFFYWLKERSLKICISDRRLGCGVHSQATWKDSQIYWISFTYSKTSRTWWLNDPLDCHIKRGVMSDIHHRPVSSHNALQCLIKLFQSQAEVKMFVAPLKCCLILKKKKLWASQYQGCGHHCLKGCSIFLFLSQPCSSRSFASSFSQDWFWRCV